MTTIALGIVLCFFLWSTLHHGGSLGPVAVAAACMARVSMVADIHVTFGPFETNLGNAYYVPVLMAISLHRARNGLAESMKLMVALFAAQIFSVVSCAFVAVSPIDSGEAMVAFERLSRTTMRVSSVSFVAFWISAVIVLGMHRRPVLGQFVSQAVDSCAFFPLALAGTGYPVFRMLMGSIAMKWLIIAFSAAPIVWRESKWASSREEKEVSDAKRTAVSPG